MRKVFNERNVNIVKEKFAFIWKVILVNRSVHKSRAYAGFLDVKTVLFFMTSGFLLFKSTDSNNTEL